MELKPQDIVVGLLVASQMQLNSYLNRREMAGLSGLSLGEVANCYKRLSVLHLIVPAPRLNGTEPSAFTNRLNVSAMTEFLCYGVRYYSQPEVSGYGRGVPTGWNCPALSSPGGMISRDVPLAWPSSSGGVNGELITPIHQCAVRASAQNPFVYAMCSLIDVMRVGRPREISIARDQIKNTMEAVNEQQRIRI